jgi:hypothetical protein
MFRNASPFRSDWSLETCFFVPVTSAYIQYMDNYVCVRVSSKNNSGFNAHVYKNYTFLKELIYYYSEL